MTEDRIDKTEGQQATFDRLRGPDEDETLTRLQSYGVTTREIVNLLLLRMWKAGVSRVALTDAGPRTEIEVLEPPPSEQARMDHPASRDLQRVWRWLVIMSGAALPWRVRLIRRVEQLFEPSGQPLGRAYRRAARLEEVVWHPRLASDGGFEININNQALEVNFRRVNDQRLELTLTPISVEQGATP